MNSSSSHNSADRLGIFTGRRYNHSLGLENASRTTAFALIENKGVAAKAKGKTQLCKSVSQGTVCRYGKSCTYAHSQSEIVKQECAFGSRCKSRHSKTNPCRFDHTTDFTPAPASNPHLATEVRKQEEEKAVARAALKAEEDRISEARTVAKAALMIKVAAAKAAYKAANSFIITFNDEDYGDEEEEEEEIEEEIKETEKEKQDREYDASYSSMMEEFETSLVVIMQGSKRTMLEELAQEAKDAMIAQEAKEDEEIRRQARELAYAK